MNTNHKNTFRLHENINMIPTIIIHKLHHDTNHENTFRLHENINMIPTIKILLGYTKI